ncbi:MAG: hypothetical protein V1754_04640 [Pseudomonadota bacterium]
MFLKSCCRVLAIVIVEFAVIACGGNSEPPEPDLASVDTMVEEPFGKICDNIGGECPDKGAAGEKLLCLSLEGSTPGKGYCTPACNDKTHKECFGVPNGQWATCSIKYDAGDGTDPAYYCGFICKSEKGNWDCPPGLNCPETKEGGTSFCVP